MSGTELIRLAFEDHWVFMTLLCPGTTFVYTFLTGKWGWCFVAWLWHETTAWARHEATATHVVNRLKKVSQ